MTVTVTLLDDEGGLFFYRADDVEEGGFTIFCVEHVSDGWSIDFSGGEEPRTTRFCTQEAAVDAASRVAFAR